MPDNYSLWNPPPLEEREKRMKELFGDINLEELTKALASLPSFAERQAACAHEFKEYLGRTSASGGKLFSKYYRACEKCDYIEDGLGVKVSDDTGTD